MTMASPVMLEPQKGQTRLSVGQCAWRWAVRARWHRSFLNNSHLHQTGGPRDTVSSAETPLSFPPSSNSGGGERDIPARENPQVHPPRDSYLGENEVIDGRTRGQTREA